MQHVAVKWITHIGNTLSEGQHPAPTRAYLQVTATIRPVTGQPKPFMIQLARKVPLGPQMEMC